MSKTQVDPGDESLLTLIDKLAGLLERTELNELEVQVGSTGLVLRKPSAVMQAAPVGVPAGTGPAPAATDGATPMGSTSPRTSRRVGRSGPR